MKLTDAKIWNSKNAPLCRVFANRVTNEYNANIGTDLIQTSYIGGLWYMKRSHGVITKPY